MIARTMRIVLLIVVLASIGCYFRVLQRDTRKMKKLGSFEARVEVESPQEGPLIVFLSRPSAPREIINYWIMDTPEEFMVRTDPGRFLVYAFEDVNRDFVHQPTERSGRCCSSEGVEVKSGRGVQSVVVRIPDERFPIDFPVDLSEASVFSVFGKFEGNVGAVTSLDDPRFAGSSARKGLWEPLKFLEKFGMGIYFLEEYDPEKVPVLFVHGASGSPTDWSFLVENLDRSRLQPWFLHYPSGLPLEGTATQLYRRMDELHARLEFDRLYVVAHSMGGLVALSFIQKNATDGGEDYVRRFVTLSAPWGGHSAAKLGVKYAPWAIPSWRDMQPGSEFLESLLSRPVPDGIEFHLLFGYHGGSIWAPGTDDGSVSLKSNLEPRIQEEADTIFGFDESHVGILTSEPVSAKLNEFLR